MDWFGHDWVPHWFLLACAGVVLVLLFMWFMQHWGY
jgi:hypothetical protein